MSEQRRRHLRNTPSPVIPANFVPIDRPTNLSLRGGVAVMVGMSALAAAIVFALVTLLFDPEERIIYAWTAAAGAAVGATVVVSSMRRTGRRRREDFVRSGGDPTGVSDLMFGVMRGRRTAEGTWEVPPQGAGDYV